MIAIAPKIHPDPSELSSSVDNNVTSSQPLEDYDEITTTAGTDFDSPPNGSLAYYTVADEPGNLRVFNFWIQALFIKLVPCFLLTALTIMLIVAMHEANVRRMKLKSQGRRDESERAREHNRTTAMLLAVVGLFQLVELPHGVLTLCSIFLPDFHNKVYTALGDVIDIMALLNNSINFVLYCTMSRQFRDQFVETFFCSGAMAVLQSSSGPSTQQRSVSGSTTATAGSSSGWTRLKAIPCSVFKSPNRPLPLPPTTTNAADRAKTGSCNGGDCAVDPPNCWASNC